MMTNLVSRQHETFSEQNCTTAHMVLIQITTCTPVRILWIDANIYIYILYIYMHVHICLCMFIHGKCASLDHTFPCDVTLLFATTMTTRCTVILTAQAMSHTGPASLFVASISRWCAVGGDRGRWLWNRDRLLHIHHGLLHRMCLNRDWKAHKNNVM